LKVAIVGSTEFDSLEFHLKDELLFSNHQVEIFDFETIINSKITLGLNLMSEKVVQYLNNRLLNKVLNYKPDLVIGVYRNIHPSFVKSIKDKRIKIIHINPDQMTTLLNQQIFVEPYDCYFTKDNYMYSFMKNKLAFNVKLYNEAFNPRFHVKPLFEKNKAELEINIDLLCFGNLYPYRNRMLSLINDNEIKLSLYGHRAKYFLPELEVNYKNKAIYGQEKAKILYGSKIVLNNFHYAEIESVNNKFFEINGVGAFQLCDYSKILHDILPIDPEKVSFKTSDELKSKIKYYLNEPEERYFYSEKIYNHFLLNYTYKNLIKFILEEI
jgi:spore maturation protein CgeB